MTEIGPKTQTPALIGDAESSASKDPFAFLSLGEFENLLDAEMIALVMGGVLGGASLEDADASFDAELGSDMSTDLSADLGAGDGEETPLAAAQALLALAEVHLRPGAMPTGADPQRAAQILKKAEILAARAMAVAAGENASAQAPGKAALDAAKALPANLAGGEASGDGEFGKTGKPVTELWDKNIARLAAGKLSAANGVGDGASDTNKGNPSSLTTTQTNAAPYLAGARGVKTIDAATLQANALGINSGLNAGLTADADADMYTTNGLLAAQMRAKGETQAIETTKVSGVSASASGDGLMSSENGFSGGRENGAGGTAGAQTPLAGGRNAALHLDMLTKDWNEKMAQALEQRISGGGKEIDFMLTPKSLGRLRVSMSMIEGQLSLAIKTDTAMAAAMLGDAESQLVQMLEARDLRVASFAASTSGQPGQQNDGASQGDKSPTREGRSESEDEIDAVEKVSALTADEDGINVTA